jgi:hypothetical protein
MRRALLRGRLPAPEKAFEWLDARSGGRRLWLEVATQAWASRST